MTNDPNKMDNLQDDPVDLSSTESPEAGTTTANEQYNTAEGDSGSLHQENERLKEELEQSKEQTLRALADVQNIRRRAEQDVEKAHKFGLEKFVKDILSVADNLERALAACGDQDQAGDVSAIAEGVDLTLKSLLGTLSRHQVEQVDPVGEPFDPQYHQAMTAIEQPDVEPNTVINVFQRGYTLHGRLVRPAMVVVSKSADNA